MAQRVGMGLVLLGLLAAAAPAQGQMRVDVGAWGGGSFPTGDVADLYSIGYTFGGTVRLRPKDTSLGIQFDGGYMTQGKDVNNVIDGGIDIYGLSVSASWAAELDVSPIAPFALVGVGVYNLAPQFERTTEQYGTKTRIGLNIGGGVEWRRPKSRWSPYVDVRVIGIFGSDPREGAYLTLTGGLRYVFGGKKIWW